MQNCDLIEMTVICANLCQLQSYQYMNVSESAGFTSNVIHMCTVIVLGGTGLLIDEARHI